MTQVMVCGGGEVIRIRQGHGNGTLMMRFVSTQEENHQGLTSAHPPPTHTHKKGHMSTQTEGSCLQTGKRVLTKD